MGVILSLFRVGSVGQDGLKRLYLRRGVIKLLLVIITVVQAVELRKVTEKGFYIAYWVLAAVTLIAALICIQTGRQLNLGMAALTVVVFCSRLLALVVLDIIRAKDGYIGRNIDIVLLVAQLAFSLYAVG